VQLVSSIVAPGKAVAGIIRQSGSVLPVDAGRRAVIHRLFDLLFRCPGGIVDDRLVIVMIVTVVIIAFHLENFRADLGTDFTADAGILVDNGDSGHEIPHFGLSFLTISIGTAGLQGCLIIED
jgi:hypothetical protein